MDGAIGTADWRDCPRCVHRNSDGRCTQNIFFGGYSIEYDPERDLIVCVQFEERKRGKANVEAGG